MLIRIGDARLFKAFPHCVIATCHTFGGSKYKVFNEKGEEEQAPFECCERDVKECNGMVIFDKRAILLTSTGKFLSNKDGEKIFQRHEIKGDKIKISWNEELTEWYDFSGNLIAGIEGSRKPQKLYDKDNKVIAVIEAYPLQYVNEVMDSEKNIVGLSFLLSGEKVFYWF